MSMEPANVAMKDLFKEFSKDIIKIFVKGILSGACEIEGIDNKIREYVPVDSIKRAVAAYGVEVE